MKVLCITDHNLLPDSKMEDMSYRVWKAPFLQAVERIANERPEGIIIREKLLSGIDYTDLYIDIRKRIGSEKTKLIWHDHYEALTLFLKYHPSAEWPDELFFSRREAGGMSIVDFRKIKLKYGMTVHDINELTDAKREKVPFICASNIFETSCKPGARPRGLDFLSETAKDFTGQLYALGGINSSNAASCIEAGADGVAVRSLCMKEDLSDLRMLIAM
ncbi:MAG: thiamine phosphate synthase [Candidatus Weimeria sp.]